MNPGPPTKESHGAGRAGSGALVINVDTSQPVAEESNGAAPVMRGGGVPALQLAQPDPLSQSGGYDDVHLRWPDLTDEQAGEYKKLSRRWRNSRDTPRGEGMPSMGALMPDVKRALGRKLANVELPDKQDEHYVKLAQTCVQVSGRVVVRSSTSSIYRRLVVCLSTNRRLTVH